MKVSPAQTLRRRNVPSVSFASSSLTRTPGDPRRLQKRQSGPGRGRPVRRDLDPPRRTDAPGLRHWLESYKS
jgi:hypothetical protein